MASALTETVSQYIPTFERVEAYNLQLQQQQLSTPYIVDGEDAQKEESPLQHSLVLTQPDTESVSSVSSRKSDKMQKKLDYEAGLKSNRRILRSISKTFHLQTKEQQQQQQSSSPRSQRPTLRQPLSRTVSHHEINLDNKIRSNVRNLRNNNTKATAYLRALERKELASSQSQESASISSSASNSANNLKSSNNLKNSNSNLKNSGRVPRENIAALRAADRKNSNAGLRTSGNLKNSANSSVRTFERKNSIIFERKNSISGSIRSNATSEVRSNSLKGSGSVKRQSLRTTLAKTTAELNKNIAELAKSVDTPRNSPGLPGPNFRRSSLKNSPAGSPTMRSTAMMSRTTSKHNLDSPLKHNLEFKNPALSPAVRAINLTSSGGAARPTKSSALKQSSEIRSPAFATVSPRMERNLKRDALSPKIGSPRIRSPASSSPRMETRSPASSRRSSQSSASEVRHSMPIGGKFDAINVLLHDFESQNRRTVQLTQMEHEIYQQEVAKFEAMEAKKQQRQEASAVLANNIKEHENRLKGLFIELEEKEKIYSVSEEELAAVSKEFEAELHVKSDIVGVTSVAQRLQEAANRRVLKEEWKNSTDPVAQARYRVLQAQEDLRHTQANIVVVKKELGRMKNHAGKARSSDNRLREEMRLREHMRKTGQPRERGSYVRPKGVPKSNEKRAHVGRLEEEKAKRAAKRATVALTAADLIVQHAGVSRARHVASPFRAGSPYRGAAGTGQFVR